MDSRTINTLMSSKSTVYGTPKWFFDKLDRIFNFDLDVCALDINAKVAKYITPSEDAFVVTWHGMCWMNPPYGRGIGKWINRAIDQSINNETTVVCLLPARTDTKWFQDVFNFAEILMFVKSRLKFDGMDDSAPFPSMIAIFGNIDKSINLDYCVKLSEIGNVISKYEGMFPYDNDI